MRLKRSLILITVMALAVAIGATSASAASASVVKTGKTGLGRVLVNSQGKTLYIWAHDKTSKSTCSGQCARYWPPLIAKSKPQSRGGVRAALLGTSRRADGRRQVTYHGHPLYTFVMDKKPGQTTGEGLTGFGGRWDPVSVSGAAVRKAHASRYWSHRRDRVQLSVITPRRGDTAGAGGVFSVDLSLKARNAAGNRLLSAANGYVPFLNLPGSDTFGPGKADPGAPGLVVTLSNTPAAAGGPNANLAGVFQLNAVNRHHGNIETFNDWQVGAAGFFGRNVRTTLTAYLVAGTAPGIVPAGGLTPISNVVRETFTVAG